MTTQQAFASDPKHSVWVSASAGTGKTKVLTDRVLRLMLEGVAPSKILCLTFTKAAASEMANRINTELGRWVMMEDAALGKRLHQLTESVPGAEKLLFARRLFCQVLDTPDRLKIQTIHAFCQSLMNRFPLEAGIAPHFQIIDDRAAGELLEEARLRLLGAVEGAHDKPISAALRAVAYLRPDKQFTELLREIINHRAEITTLLEAYGNIHEAIAALYHELGADPNDNERSVMLAACSNEAFHLPALMESADILLLGTEKSDQPSGIILKQWLHATPDERVNLFDGYIQIYLKKDLEKRVDVITRKMAEKYPHAAEILSREQERVHHVFEMLKTLRIALFTSHLLHISEGLLEEYRHLKAAHAFLDYHDLILMTTKLLHQDTMNQWILYKLDEGIDHILLDEAQDTSPQQWLIIRSLCEEFFAGEGSKEINRTVFVVGDEKQSIYSFQGADPVSFRESQLGFQEKAETAQKPFHLVALDTSFRSTEAVLNVVDRVFAPEALRASITFSPESITHHAHRSGHGGYVELWPAIMPPPKDKHQEPWTVPTERTRKLQPDKILAELIARKIAGWLATKELLPSQGRPIEAGDILILVRRRNDFSHYLVTALKNRHIDVAGIDRLILTEHLGIMDVMALGNFLLLPQDDLTLATVLKTPLIGLSEEALFELAHDRGNMSLWQRLKENAAYDDAYRYLSALLAKVDYASPFELYSHIIDVQNGRKRLCSRLGLEVNDLLDEFLSLALAYEQTNTPSLQGFLHWLESGDTQIKRDLEQGKNQVRIMTVHGAKGLQAPIVIMPDTMRTPDSKDELLWDEQLLYWPERAANINAHCQTLKTRQKDKDTAEYLRLLYVALTRAEDTLIICGYTGKTAPENCWYNLIKDGLLPLAEEVPFDYPHDMPSLGETSSMMLRYARAQDAPAKTKSMITAATHITSPLPEFLLIAAKEEQQPPSPLVPSAVMETEPTVRSPLTAKKSLPRGKIIHTLLQVLPSVPLSQRNAAAQTVLKHIPEAIADDLRQTVFSLLDHPDFAEVFGEGSKAEVPITGIVKTSKEQRIISGRIDRLIVTPSHILVVDFKTNRIPPEHAKDIPVAYVRQMAAYRALLREIYPDRPIRCALLWTEVPVLMPIEDNVLTQCL